MGVAAVLALAAPAPGAVPANGPSGNATVSADGRVVAFASGASNLVRGDTNGVSDVFVRTLVGGPAERVSVGAGGAQANARTGLSAIDGTGRFVVMWSDATNLVAGDTNGWPDIFVRDRTAGTTERVSVASDGTQADGESAQAAITPDGRFVAFASTATNLAAGDTDDLFDVYVRDRSTGRTERIGAGWDPSISADGRLVAFQDRDAAIVVYDRQAGTTELVSVGLGGAPANGRSFTPSISADGRLVAFTSEASNLVPGDTNGVGQAGTDVFVRDRTAGTTRRVSGAGDGTQADGGSNPTLSADGTVVAFTSFAPSLGAAHTGVFVHDLAMGATELVSVSTDEQPGDGDSYTGSAPLSADGRVVAFFSLATNLVAGDTNGEYDVFVRDRASGMTELVSAARTRRLTAEPLTLQPRPARAGELLRAALPVRVDGQWVASARVTCTARIGTTRLTTRAKSVRASTARCVWRIPSSAGGARLTGEVTVVTTTGRVTRTFATRVR